jgi:uridine monophosphate synthetase
MSEFFRRVEGRIKETGAYLCVGLDPRQEEMTADELDMLQYDPTIGLYQHGQRIFSATQHSACAWKINLAFYEAWGSAGWAALERLIPILSRAAPVLLDGKRGDIGTTASSYAKSALELGAHAVTVSPYLGKDSIKPFLEMGLDVLMLIRTTNPSAEDVQGQPLSFPMWKRVLEDAMTWSSPTQLGFVMAANDLVSLKKAREIAPNRWILSPGVGAQGADLQGVVYNGLSANGGKLIIPISRGITAAYDPQAAASGFVSEMRVAAAQCRFTKPSTSLTLKERTANEFFDCGCVKFGQFKLKSGVISPIYLDLRMLVSHPSLLAQVAELYKETLKAVRFDVLAALPYAALPIGTAVSLSMNKPMIYPRREQKTYGTCSSIEGAYQPKNIAIIIDDVITRGDSKLEAISQLESAGLQINDVCVLIDRESGGTGFLQAHGKNLISIFKFSELIEAWHLSGRVSQEQYDMVKIFLAEE